ncbi:DNA polymerase III subunit alpha [Magnetospira sp. QH-2]|uniref:DNA polymerase III subunit alpha n=1 Tax=Magnetospira sp. (strain QH-2) TaxID=1288970 RepID=UPI0003E8162B|nr:DNA polymerase III subunit alpha [Magnetospira sp. QH-2]CCQ73989.1 DNA polymerase III, alpha subunit [Magnetospira sp. QH-2]
MTSSNSYAEFVHLRVHTAYSLSEGAIKVKDLPKLCTNERMPALAITDTNNLFGAMEFSGAMAGAGVQPIIGCQLGVTRFDKAPSKGSLAPPPDSLVLLCQNEVGYHNLLKLVSKAFLETEPGDDPQIPLSALADLGEGLICLTGGLAGPVGRLLAEGQDDKAKECLLLLNKSFPGRLYVELQRHGLDGEKRIEGPLVDLAYALELPLVATNEAFFADADMFEAHDALLCVAGSTYVSQTERRRLTPEHRFKTAAEMRALFADLPEAIDNTLIIAQRCAVMVEKIDPILPPYDCGEGRGEADELREQAAAGLEKRLWAGVFPDGMSDDEREQVAKPYRERLDYELDVIAQMGFPGYFLIVSDFIKWAKTHDIPVGPGRGSGAGSVVAWALTITDLDPLRFGLLFERFLNPERVSMPDFDIDFCQDRRDEVIKYVQDKYGYDHVAQIITFGKLQARAVLRDVGRVLEMPYGQVDRITKLVPNPPGKPVPLAQAIEDEPQLREMIEDDETVRSLTEKALKLEGLYRHASTHAAGVVIGDRPLDELVPLYRDPRSDMPVTQFNMKFVESAGLVKFDFLGLKTLTVLSTAVKLIADKGVTVDLSTITLEDRPTFEMLGRAESQGVFQLESAGMRDVLKNMKPDTLEDIIAVVALYRPGPMDNIPSYIRRKHGAEEPDYLYPTLEGILKETYGIIIYQEQVMQIAQELAGYSLGGADLLRRAMGKKIAEEMEKQRKIFVDGAVAKGVPERKASEIFDLVAKFASYGFNKSHAAAYALVAYHTAYLKANHPTEFMAASMTLDINNTDKLNAFRQELTRLKIEVRQPDVNKSEVTFSVERDGEGNSAVRYALAAIKNVGAEAVRTIVEERRANGPFKDLFDFFDRLDTKAINKRQLENMVRAGALDSLERNRHKLFESLETLIAHANVATAERNSNQMGMFGDSGMESAKPKLANVSEWMPMDKLKEEFDAIGFYLSAHPLDAYGQALKRLDVVASAELLETGRSGAVKLAGTVVAKKERTSARGNRFAFVSLSDASGAYEVTLFSEQLAQARDLLEAGNSLFIRAAAEFDDDRLRLTANSVESLEVVAGKTDTGLRLRVMGTDVLEPLGSLLAEQKKGRGEIRLTARLEDATEVEMTLKDRYSVSPTLVQALQFMEGVAEVREV